MRPIKRLVYLRQELINVLGYFLALLLFNVVEEYSDIEPAAGFIFASDYNALTLNVASVIIYG
jgi:hypothetical protein